MVSEQIAFLLLGTLSTLVGLGMIFLSWKSRIQLKDTFTSVGWLLLVLALIAWIGLSGWEFGLIYGLTLPSLAALLLVGFNAESNNSGMSNLPRMQLATPSQRAVLKTVFRVLLIVPFALVTSVFISYTLGVLLLEVELNQMVLAICVLPVIWGVFAWWLLADTRRLRPILSLIGITALCFVPLLGVG